MRRCNAEPDRFRVLFPSRLRAIFERRTGIWPAIAKTSRGNAIGCVPIARKGSLRHGLEKALATGESVAGQGRAYAKRDGRHGSGDETGQSPHPNGVSKRNGDLAPTYRGVCIAEQTAKTARPKAAVSLSGRPRRRGVDGAAVWGARGALATADRAFGCGRDGEGAIPPKPLRCGTAFGPLSANGRAVAGVRLPGASSTDCAAFPKRRTRSGGGKDAPCGGEGRFAGWRGGLLVGGGGHPYCGGGFGNGERGFRKG